MRTDLDEARGGRRPGQPTGRIGRVDHLGHEDVPALARLAARIAILVRSIPDRIGASRSAGLDPGKDVDRIAHSRRTVADLYRWGPARPSAGGARSADEDLAKRRIARVDIANDIQVA